MKAKTQFHKLSQKGKSSNSSGSSHSISPPFGDPVPRSASVPLTRDESSDSTTSDDTVLFETDSAALTSIFLRDLVNSKGYDRERRTAKVSFKPKNFGVVTIPGAHLQLRCTNRQVRAVPVKLAYHHTNQSIAFATAQRYLCHVDENLGAAQQIHLPDSDISDLHWLSFNSVSYVVASTYDGCTHLWRPGSSKLAATWRTDASYLCENLPQLSAVAPSYAALVTVRGNGGVALWDLETQQLAGEWDTREANVVSALCVRPDNPKIVIAGYSNGAIVAIDMRVSSTDSASKVWGVNIGDSVLQIRDNRNGAERMYAASTAGKVFIWDAASHRLEPSVNLKCGLGYFDLHSALPIAAIGRAKEPPVLYRTTDAAQLCVAKGVDPASIFAFHPILPTITFGLPNGHLISYDIAVAPDQK
jgi:WD40 repeat protein